VDESVVRVEQMKWPDRPHYALTALLLGEDEHGRWLGVREAAEMMRGSHVVFLTRSAGVICVPHNEWYVAHFPANHEPDVYVDIATPPTWTDVNVSMVDLDLDVVITDGDVSVVDEEEFESNRVRYGYPSDVVAMARRVAAEVVDAARRASPPFTRSTGDAWLDGFVGLAGGGSRRGS
jgi:uncharacterized protein